MKKISLFKSLALLGAVCLTSVCVVETALLMHKNSDQPGVPQVGDVINLNAYNGYTLAHTIENYGDVNSYEIQDFLRNDGIHLNAETPIKLSNTNDLEVFVGDGIFYITAISNSPTYVAGSSAEIYYPTPSKTNIVSILGNNPVAYIDDKFEDEELTKSNVLNSLKTSYPTLNINHLSVAWNGAYGPEGNAIVSVKQNSSLYLDNSIGVTYNTSGSVSMELDKNVIAQGQTATPTFKYHGTTITAGITYSCSAPSANFSFVAGTGVLTYTTGNTADFFGGAYSISASYTTGVNTYTASQIVFAQNNLQTGTLTCTNYNIKTGALNSGTATMKVNGVSKTVTSWAVTGGLTATVNAEGLSFSNGVITWNGTTNTLGGIYTITATYSGTGIKTATASAQVFVSQSHILKDIGFTIASGWVLERNLTHYDAITRLLTIDLVIHINGYSYSVSNYQVGTFSSLPSSFTRQNLVSGWMTYGDLVVLGWTEGSNKLVARPTAAYTSSNAQLYLSATFYL